MGQYYYVVNTTKKEYLNPHDFGEGAKLREFGVGSYGTLSALALLLCVGHGLSQLNELNEGDLYSQDTIIGKWAGDTVIVAGDYGAPALFTECSNGHYKNISLDIIAAMCDDHYFKKMLLAHNAKVQEALDRHKTLAVTLSYSEIAHLVEKMNAENWNSLPKSIQDAYNLMKEDQKA